MHLHHKYLIIAALVVTAGICGIIHEVHRHDAKLDRHTTPVVVKAAPVAPPVIDMTKIGARLGLVAPPGMELVLVIDKTNNCSWSAGRDMSKAQKAIFNVSRTAIGIIQKTN